MKTKLKPCPLCGASASYGYIPDECGGNMQRAGCDDGACGLSFSFYDEPMREVELIQRWNLLAYTDTPTVTPSKFFNKNSDL
jgi:hypothetical protein